MRWSLVFFFFKQKTAYEMRISDWSSDVCSSDLNDVEALEKRLKRLPAEAGKLVVLEGVYSMLGDVAPLKEMIRVSKEAGAMILVDEAHSMGFIGEHGRGVAEAQGVIGDVDFIIGTFSKSVGTVGGFCVSNHPKFEILQIVCRDRKSTRLNSSH